MRILFLTPNLPRPDGGGAAIRNWHLIQAARAAGHSADICTFCEPNARHSHACDDVAVSESPPGERGTRGRMIDLFICKEPDLARRLRSGGLAVALGKWLRQSSFSDQGDYDVIQVEGLEMWANLPQTLIA